jgi:hypothetical protein
MFMKVIWPTVNYLSTVNTNFSLIRCLQHWHLISLGNWLSIPVHESKITLKFFIVGCIKILAWHWHSPGCAGIVLLQLLEFVLRVWLVNWFSGFGLDFPWLLSLRCGSHLSVKENYMDDMPRDLSLLNLLGVIHLKWTGDSGVFIPHFCAQDFLVRQVDLLRSSAATSSDWWPPPFLPFFPFLMIYHW